MFKEILLHAKIGIGEFGKLAGVSRVTASLWANGHAKPHILHAKRINKLLGDIELLVARSHLPLSGSLPKAQRIEAIKQLIHDLSLGAQA